MNLIRVTDYYKFILFTIIFSFVFPKYADAENYSIHFSEEGVIKNKDILDEPLELEQSESKFLYFINEKEKTNNQQTAYLTTTSQKILDTDLSNKNKDYLGGSTKFEMYKIGENTTSHTIFESGAGICKGYQSQYGVDITDSRTYYFDKRENEYYASITSATIYSKNAPKYTQYAPIFNIKDPENAQNIQNDENKYGMHIAKRNIQNTSKVLYKTICK
ncbi:hypothetical protein EV697_101177 [Bisgaardia hudsonensis]|uniref:DUF8095 domain-containing protein n=1 Tax=Bisgaardia hudsonensis TaxID=109472 RepID=A0A4R2N2K6_9PAST|nr:hypothetical protein [Bisgaardia hudsonensis]QLB12510.1 hypothetical protein A6A11_02280 [Bisgaardia hudsonensis]TCP14049.1 hypothetical protein EV697_101177 [Bisgaardia hudsonensis]